MPLKPITTNVNLQKGEEAYFSGHARRQELKKVRTGGGQIKGGGLSVPVGGGVRAHVGGVTRAPTTYAEQWQETDNGELIITNKRMIFMGNKVTSLTWGRILDMEFLDCIDVIKSSGKPLTLCLTEGEAEEIEIIWNRLRLRSVK